MVPYQRPAANGGIVASLTIFVILALLLLGACGVITNGVASMVDSTTTNGASVVNTWTQESNATTRTRIEWDGRKYLSDNEVKIAGIQADTTKKTSFAFVLFWVVRLLFWVAGIMLALWVVALAWNVWEGEGNA